jgi:hypothetical protein
VLHYEPWGSALDQLPTRPYFLTEVYAEYEVEPNGTDDFLFIVLERIEDHYGLPGFATDFAVAFEAFLQTVDADEETEGIQPYLDPWGEAILTLADTHWFGPRQTWPKELANYPYIEFWHRLDEALSAEDVPELGTELLGGDAWAALFSTGTLSENRDITIWVYGDTSLVVRIEEMDQLGSARPANAMGDIGAIEIP